METNARQNQSLTLATEKRDHANELLAETKAFMKQGKQLSKQSQSMLNAAKDFFGQLNGVMANMRGGRGRQLEEREAQLSELIEDWR